MPAEAGAQRMKILLVDDHRLFCEGICHLLAQLDDDIEVLKADRCDTAIYHIAHNPAHQWFYFPQMERTEALVFKVFDSDAGKPSRFTAHSAFDDPGTPPDAPPRESIETRTFAFFD